MSRIRTALTLSVLAACGTTPDEGADTDTDVFVQDVLVGSCAYRNPFSDGDECKEYVGSAWTPETAAADCEAPLLTAGPGAFRAEAACDSPSELGRCVIEGGTDTENVLVFPGQDPASCGGVQTGCAFGQGVFEPSAICADELDPGVTSNVFVPFEEVCEDPIDGEAAGDGPDGKVCTVQAISACTEEDRKYTDYASCDPVFTQRPYTPYPATDNAPADDDRLDDTDWVREFDWVTKQVESCACVCCHSTEAAPNGTSGWYIEADPIWIDTLDNDGLAMLAGWVDSTAFGAIDPADNNGFDRETTGLPTTDVARMQAFLEGELARRGLDEDDFAETRPFGGPLYDQLFHEPEPCGDGQGVDDEGQLVWTGGPARYLYVLEADSMAPGVPPNLDLPEGTLWRWDVDHRDDPVRGPITYGTTPEGAFQTYPVMGPPPALVSGETYYLYALRDVYQPATRCLFEAP